MKESIVNYEVSLRTVLTERKVVASYLYLSTHPKQQPTSTEKEKENKKKTQKYEQNSKQMMSNSQIQKGIKKRLQNGTGSQDCTVSHSSTHTDFEKLSHVCLNLALSARAAASSESVVVFCAYMEVVVYTLPIVFCTLYTLPVVFSPLYTDFIVYTLAIVVFSPPVAVLPPHRPIEFAESSTTIFAMSLPNRAIGFRVFDVTRFFRVEMGLCTMDEVGFCVEMGFCIVNAIIGLRVFDSVGFCEKGFFCTVVELCAIEAKVDVDDELEVIVLVISRKSRLVGRSVLRLACCDGLN